MSSAAEIEKKLAEYRAKRAKEEKINAAKTKINSLLNSLAFKKKMPENEKKDDSLTEPLLEEDIYLTETSNKIETSSILSDDESINCFTTYTTYDIVYYVLIFFLWCILYTIFIKLQFGIVFLIISALIFMFYNTRTGPKKPTEVSAYSVFNKNCESIDGTLKAEQFEREIRYGAGGVR